MGMGACTYVDPAFENVYQTFTSETSYCVSAKQIRIFRKIYTVDDRVLRMQKNGNPTCTQACDKHERV